MNSPSTTPPAPETVSASPVRATPARASSSGLPLLKRALVKRHALACVRAGMGRKKFTRVGQSFIDEVQAEFDMVLRQFTIPNLSDDFTEGPHPSGFLSRELRAKVIASADRLAARLIERKITRHPAIGKTLLAIRG